MSEEMQLGLDPEASELLAVFQQKFVACTKDMKKLTKPAKVQSAIELDSDEVCVLEKGTIVEVLQVVRREDLGRIRAEISHPSGWISLYAFKEQVYWVVPAKDLDLTEQEMNWLTPDILDTYVRARPTLDERAAILRETLQWRIDNRALLSDRVCPRCTANPLSHDARCFGTDLEGDLVFMNCFALPRDLDPDGIAQHMACVFERSLREYPGAKQWTWIIHMHGFGLQHMDPRTSIKLLHLLQVAYRDRLKRCIVLDAPRVFQGLWSALQPFIKEKTHKRITFDQWPDIRDELFSTLGKAVAERVSFEIDENKDPERVKSKTWTTYWATPDSCILADTPQKAAGPEASAVADSNPVMGGA